MEWNEFLSEYQMNLFIMSTTTEEHNYIHLAQYRPNSFKIYIALINGKQSLNLEVQVPAFYD